MPWSEVRMLEAGGGGLVEETIVNNKVVGMDEQVEDGKRQQVRGQLCSFYVRRRALGCLSCQRSNSSTKHFYTTVGLMHILDFKAPLEKKKSC